MTPAQRFYRELQRRAEHARAQAVACTLEARLTAAVMEALQAVQPPEEMLLDMARSTGKLNASAILNVRAQEARNSMLREILDLFELPPEHWQRADAP